MSFQRYPEYKDSGVEWLGEVPAHWGVLRLKNVLAQKVTDGPHTTPVFIDEGVPFLSVDGIQNGELVFDGCRFVSEDDHAEFKRKASPRRNDLLMGKAASTGKIARVKVDFDFSIWSPLALIRIDRNAALPEFVEYILKSKATQAEIDNYCTANTQKNISMDDIPRLILTHPPIEEQTAIATFLDHETAKIDALVAEQEKLIALLQEKRQAVISHAVTKGLNPNVPMKDSGVEWLGEVPEHWAVGKCGFYLRILSGFAFPSSGFTDDDSDHRLLRGANVGVSRLKWDDTVYWQRSEGDGLDDYEMVEGDLVIGMDRPLIGEGMRVAKVTAEDLPSLLLQRVASLKVGSKLHADYLHYLLASEMFIAHFSPETTGVSVPHISPDQINKFIIPIPPMSEQLAIVNDVKRLLTEFGGLIAESEIAITLLQERRSALISAAVTGQIDVRNWSVSESA
ncbi:restriction endonuclease subunit S [Comamonas jiangduensis]|uniref:restriction endonuclease subunit S n=1 Tax=Comamonas jiangduensis TaxID=1194168 RepID=UPI0024E104AA|nr:restriction endonuclease subunit S [Comamonas jiangduensis]